MRTPVEHLIWLIMDPQQMEIYKEEIEQALQMEKEHIIVAHGDKKKTTSNPNSIVTFGYTYTGDMYYNEKYKGIKPII